jgi:hypothetical protein
MKRILSQSGTRFIATDLSYPGNGLSGNFGCSLNEVVTTRYQVDVNPKAAARAWRPAGNTCNSRQLRGALAGA